MHGFIVKAGSELFSSEENLGECIQYICSTHSLYLTHTILMISKRLEIWVLPKFRKR